MHDLSFHPRWPGKERRGALLIECLIALGIMLAAAVMISQILMTANRQRQVAEQRRLALQEIANLLERGGEFDWAGLTVDQWQAAPLSLAVQEQLPQPQLRAEIGTEAGPLEFKRVRLELTWLNPAGERARGVAASRWFHRGALERSPAERPAEGQP